MRKFIEGLIGLAFFLVMAFGGAAVLAWLFQWNVPGVPAAALLNVVVGFFCLVGLIFILKVPWDLHFETRSILFEMKRSVEAGIPVKPDRQKYVTWMNRLTLAVAVGAHIASAGLIAAITYFSNGQVGYYFAGFYLLSTFFRPIFEAHTFVLAKLNEIRGEVKVPREDAIKLRDDLTSIQNDLKALRERLDAVEHRLENRIVVLEEAEKQARENIAELRLAIERTDMAFKSRMQHLTDEVERSLTKAFDQQEIVTGLRAFARLIKEA